MNTDPNAKSFDFSIRSQSFDGRIPEDYANYTSGLNSNDYLLRAYVTSYIQLDEVRVHVTNETLSTRSEIPLIRTGIFRITVHFKNSNSTGATLVDNPILQSGSLTVSAYDMRGVLWAQNTTLVTAGSDERYTGVAGNQQRSKLRSHLAFPAKLRAPSRDLPYQSHFHVVSLLLRFRQPWSGKLVLPNRGRLSNHRSWTGGCRTQFSHV